MHIFYIHFNLHYVEDFKIFITWVFYDFLESAENLFLSMEHQQNGKRQNTTSHHIKITGFEKVCKEIFVGKTFPKR